MKLDINWYLIQEDLFSDILYTSDNPAVIKTERTFKEGDKVKKVTKTEKFDLISNDLLSELKKAPSKEIEFYQKGFLKLFKKYNTKQLIKELVVFDTSIHNWILVNSKMHKAIDKSKFVFTGKFIIDDGLGDEVILGSRLSKCIVNKDTGEYYIDTESLNILTLI